MAYASSGISSFYLCACTHIHTQMTLHTHRDTHTPMYAGYNLLVWDMFSIFFQSCKRL